MVSSLSIPGRLDSLTDVEIALHSIRGRIVLAGVEAFPICASNSKRTFTPFKVPFVHWIIRSRSPEQFVLKIGQ